jgi:hypothetical protein
MIPKHGPMRVEDHRELMSEISQSEARLFLKAVYNLDSTDSFETLGFDVLARYL